jgi:quercetin dioxygenase-like cupin family protein
MLTRRGFAGCALCALTGFVATAAEAEAPPAPTGIKRTILRRIEGPTPEYETIIAQAEVDPGFAVPRHFHPGIESAYIAEGSGVFLLDGAEPQMIKAGDAVQVPTRRIHAVKNGDRPMKIVSTYILEKGQPLAIPAPA